MASRKASKVVSALACRYSFRGKKQLTHTGDSSVQPEETVIEKSSKSVSSKTPGSSQNGPGRGKKRKSFEIKLEPETAVEIKLEPETEVDALTNQHLASQDTQKQESDEICTKVARTTVKKENDEVRPETSITEDGWFPANWELALNNIRKMRKEVEAPVDTMGCDQCHDTSTSPVIQRYQILVSLMLSSQTKDQVTHAAVGRLKEHGLTPDIIVKTDTKVLEDLITPVSFYRRKSEYIKKASQILLDKYGGDIPDTVEKLCELPGVGPKMAHICMKSAWNVVSGIGVDVHVHRISHRIGWLPPNVMKKKKKLTPEDTREALESWLPKPLWSEVNHLLVGFGQTICKPVGPSCSSCLNNSFCPKLKW